MSASTSKFDFGTRLGYSYIAQAAALSLFFVAAALSRMAYDIVKFRRKEGKWPPLTIMQVYTVALFFFDFVLATGRILILRWMIIAEVREGPYCTAEGVLRQVGDAAVAMVIMAIAIHTFLVLVLQIDSKPITAVYVCGLIVLFNILSVGLGFATHMKRKYYGNTGNWCWIIDKYPVQRIVLEYGWMWAAAAINVVVYVSVATVYLRGSRFWGSGEGSARQMLGYPLVYLITVTPISITRWLSFSHKHIHVPIAVTVIASILLSLSGFFNVLLYRWKKPDPEARQGGGGIAIEEIMAENNRGSRLGDDKASVMHDGENMVAERHEGYLAVYEEERHDGIQMRQRQGISMGEIDEGWRLPTVPMYGEAEIN